MESAHENTPHPRGACRGPHFLNALLLSSVYGFFHVVGNRRSYQNKIQGHIYASAVADLPWNDKLATETGILTRLRSALLKARERPYEQATKLAEEAGALRLRPLKEVVRDKTGVNVAKNEAFAVDPSLIVATWRGIRGQNGSAPLKRSTPRRLCYLRSEREEKRAFRPPVRTTTAAAKAEEPEKFN
jgi:hypothetical protein